MSALPIIEMAIGLIFAYVLLSILCSIINEWIANIASLRSKNLKSSLCQLLDDPNLSALAKDVWEHPLIKDSKDDEKGPAYIASNTFARVIIDLIDQKSGLKAKIATQKTELEAAIDQANLPANVVTVMKSLIDDADTSIKDFQKNVGVWFDNAMDRLSGVYKRWLQIVSLVIAFLLTAGLNVDTITIAQTLWKNPELRSQIADEVAVAVEMCREKENLEECTILSDVTKTRNKLEMLPVGWSSDDKMFSNPGIGSFILKFIGLVLTTLAVSLGAPFWFDVLNKLNSLRSTGTKPKPAN